MSILNCEDEDYNPDIYTLTDEDGEEQMFELLDVLEYEGKNYFALTPYFENEEDYIEDEGDLIILRGEIEDESDLEIMVSIDDDDEYQKIGNMFIERLTEFFDQVIYDDE